MRGTRRGAGSVVALATIAAILGCGSGDARRAAPRPGLRAASPLEDPPPPPPPPPAGAYPLACGDLYDADTLVTYEVEVSAATWAALQEDFLQGEEVWYPAVFRHGAEVVPNAAIRLRGNRSSCGAKLQFAISFNQVDPGGRFHGLRRIDLDHGGCRLLHERLALAFFRDLGVPAPCANNARLFVNGAYYGLFVNVEHVNKDFLRRSFGPDDDGGDLWKGGWELKTNESHPDRSRLEAYEAAGNAATLASLADLDAAVREWAVEAALPARDNYWLHGWNYYLYDHPARGFLFVPYDMDAPFGSPPWDAQPILPEALQRAPALALADPRWRARFDEAVRRAIDAYDPAVLEARLDAWWPQISAAAAADPNQEFTESNVNTLRAQLRARANYLRSVRDDPAAW